MDTDWQSYTHWFAVVLFSGTLSYFVSLSSMGLARRSGMITQPGARQSHDVATPTGGGLGLVFSVVVTSLLLQLFTPLPLFWSVNVLPGIILLATIGWFDDCRHVSFRLRLMVQLTVSLWLIGFSGLQFSPGGMAWFLGIIAALMWMMNLYNFMDGSNGNGVNSCKSNEVTTTLKNQSQTATGGCCDIVALTCTRLRYHPGAPGQSHT